jgi:hypothetical protein
VFQALPNDDRRVDQRFSGRFRTVFIESAIFGEHVQIVNLARRGFLARTRVSYKSGSKIGVHFPELGVLAATVVWTANWQVGGSFDDPIDERQFAALLAALARPD